MNPLDEQVGGSHYKDYRIQPVEFIHANKLGFCVGNAIKYLCRYQQKNGIEDLKKARHYIDILIQFENMSKLPEIGEQKGVSWKEIENATDEEIRR